eukprot:731315-Rhodomonas_salina.1
MAWRPDFGVLWITYRQTAVLFGSRGGNPHRIDHPPWKRVFGPFSESGWRDFRWKSPDEDLPRQPRGFSGCFTACFPELATWNRKPCLDLVSLHHIQNASAATVTAGSHHREQDGDAEQASLNVAVAGYSPSDFMVLSLADGVGHLGVFKHSKAEPPRVSSVATKDNFAGQDSAELREVSGKFLIARAGVQPAHKDLRRLALRVRICI